MTTFKRAKGLVSSFVNVFVPDLINKSVGIYNYGYNNLLPNELVKYIADSGIATRCVGKVSEYIASNGFVDKANASLKVNEKQTANKLLQEQAINAAMFRGFAYHISRKGGKISSVVSIPFQCIRKKTDGNFLYNPTFGQKLYDKTQDKTYPAFVGSEMPTSILSDPKYKDGEVFYVYQKTPFNSYYPVPDYYSGIEEIRTSSELAKMDLELALNGFMPSAIVTVVGNIDDSVEDDNGKTEMDYIRDDFKKFTGEEKENGISGRFKGLLMHAPSKEDLPQITTFDAKSILEASNNKRDIIGREVCKLFGVHPVLVGFSDAQILGNQQALSNCSLELTKTVDHLKRMLIESFEMMFPNMDWSISEYLPINYVPDALLSDMTQNERREKFLGLPPITNTNVSINQQG